MIARKKGAIVNIVSIAGRNGGGPGAGPYSSSKGGLITFTKSLAKELAPHGIRVNAVSPGVIDTPFHEQFSTPEMIAKFVKGIPLGRVGTSMECATAIAFLASDAAAYVVGETLEVNGGQLMLKGRRPGANIRSDGRSCVARPWWPSVRFAPRL